MGLSWSVVPFTLHDHFSSVLVSPNSILEDSAVYTCTVEANNDGSDDSPAILAAFKECRTNRRIVFSNTTYNIEKMMTTTDLENTQIEIHGTLVVRLDNLAISVMSQL